MEDNIKLKNSPCVAKFSIRDVIQGLVVLTIVVMFIVLIIGLPERMTSVENTNLIQDKRITSLEKTTVALESDSRNMKDSMSEDMKDLKEDMLYIRNKIDKLIEH